MKKLRLALSVIAAMLTTGLFAQPGTLDSTFNSNGIQTTNMFGDEDHIYSMAIQSDGKIVVAGSAYYGMNDDFGLARYNTNGSLDTSFSNDGKVYTPVLSGRDDYAQAVAIQPDGKIVAAGYSYNGTQNVFALVRYNTNGTLDNSFGTSGKVTTVIGEDDIAKSVCIQPDGKIIVAGYSSNGSNNDFALARYKSNGTLDSSFRYVGKLTTNISGGDDNATSMVLQPNGKIIVAGSSSYLGNDVFTFARYNANGYLDNTFGTLGVQVVAILADGLEEANSLVLQNDGKIIAAGYASYLTIDGFTSVFAMVRIDSTGASDNSFGASGKDTVVFFGGGTDIATSLVLMPDHKVILAGYNLEHGSFALARFDGNGVLDTDFGNNGKVLTQIGSGGRAYSVSLQPDGKIVVAGEAVVSDWDFALARYITGLNIGIIDFSISNRYVLIYPNPITQNATLEYTLKDPEEISVQLFDMQGGIVKTFLENEKQNAGEHQQTLVLPEGLASGSYLIVISSSRGQESIKIVK